MAETNWSEAAMDAAVDIADEWELGLDGCPELARIIDKHTALRWTSERPTEGGRYWFRSGSSGRSWIVRVYDPIGSGLMVDSGSGECPIERYHRDGDKWCRIPEPVEASDA